MLTAIVVCKVIDQAVEAFLVHLVPMRTLREVDIGKELAIRFGIVALLVGGEGAAPSAVVPNVWADLRNVDVIALHADPVTIQAAFGEERLFNEGGLARLPLRNCPYTAISPLLLEPLRKTCWVQVARQTVLGSFHAFNFALKVIILVLE